MTGSVRKIGDILKSRREELKFSIKEIESSTSIRSNYLEAIENGISDQFLSSVYMFGFIRQYASFLGLDMQQLSKEYPEVFSPTKVKHEFVHGIGTLEARGSLGGGVKWFSNLMWAAATAVGLIVIYYLAKAVGII
jgi:cytoskeletal protein RodZ